MNPNEPTPVVALKSRRTLKSYFTKGRVPSEQNFADLIDSSVNRLDDGFASDPGNGLQAIATPPEGRALAFCLPASVPKASPQPVWFVALVPGAGGTGLSFVEAAPAPQPDSEGQGATRLHLQAGGNVGIGTPTPNNRLEVNGFVASRGRIGAYQDPHLPGMGNEVPADGKWYPILAGLDGLHAFEVVAAAYGPTGQGRYALAHATALSAFGKSRSRIFRKSVWFWGWFQQIQFRWTGELHAYGLEMRTASSFGEGSRIVYHITHLFDDRRPVGDSL